MKNSIKKGLNKSHRAFTLIELLVVVGISVLIGILSFTAFTSLYNFQSLDKDTDVVLSYIEKARTQTINSKNLSEYGIFFSSSSVTIFEGKQLSWGSISTTYNLSTKVEMSEINLSTTSSSVYFNKISGEPSATGTITYRLKNSASTTKQIIIYGTGLSEIQ